MLQSREHKNVALVILFHPKPNELGRRPWEIKEASNESDRARNRRARMCFQRTWELPFMVCDHGTTLCRSRIESCLWCCAGKSTGQNDKVSITRVQRVGGALRKGVLTLFGIATAWSFWITTTSLKTKGVLLHTYSTPRAAIDLSAGEHTHDHVETFRSACRSARDALACAALLH